MGDPVALGSTSYVLLRVAIADSLGWTRNTEGAGSDWSTEQEARLDAIMKSALTQVYYPNATGQSGQVHQWSWMRPVATLTTTAPYDTGTVTIVDGVVTGSGTTFPSWAASGDLIIAGGTYSVDTYTDGDTITLDDTSVDADALTTYSLARPLYDLPADFDGFEGDMTYLPGQAAMYPPIRLIADGMVRRRRQEHTGTRRPEYVAMRPKTFVPATGQRWEAVFEPTPDAAYDLAYRYKVQADMLDATNLYPLGGPGIGELILEGCLAVAQQRYLDGAGPVDHSAQFQRLLAAAVADDAQSFSPDTLGYNGDNSDHVIRDDRFGGDPIHTFEGTAYYD